jgi:ectoine hydroxylase-related dioxygenase (phytanoyl-CoA dioxygenase family)
MMSTTHQSFRENGYAVFPSALSDAELSLLRQSCQTLLDEPIDDGGHSGKHKIGLGSARRFLAHRHEEFPELEAFLLGNTIAKINETCLGDSGTLFNEQFVVKGSGTGASFAWHQDGAYVGFDHKAYLTIWIALDDTTEENGCVYVLPRNLNESPGLDPHEWIEESNELNGYSGEDPGKAMTCPAGTIVAFSSETLHRSGPNTTDKPRRAYICQYSVETIIDPETGKPKRYAKKVGNSVAA